MLNRTQAGVLALLLALAVTLTWQVQAWRLGRQLAAQAQAIAEERQQLSENLVRQVSDALAQRLDLEQRLQARDQFHSQELHDAEQAQARLRDRLATADLRLSVLLDADSSAAVSAASGAAGLDHDAVRAGLDPAHAGRIVAITDRGDRGLIALRGCQAYVRELLR